MLSILEVFNPYFVLLFEGIQTSYYEKIIDVVCIFLRHHFGNAHQKFSI